MPITNEISTAVAIQKYARALDRHTAALEKVANAMESQRDAIANLFESLDDLNAGTQLVLARSIDNLAFRPSDKKR
jgi:hypothetical protein